MPFLSSARAAFGAQKINNRGSQLIQVEYLEYWQNCQNNTCDCSELDDICIDFTNNIADELQERK
jgi:hypothetical protein